MAGNWEGFTEEDIGLLKKDNEVSDSTDPKKKATNLQSLGKKSAEREKTVGRPNSKYEEKIPESVKLSENAPEKRPIEGRTFIEKKREKDENERGPIIMASDPVRLKVIEGKAYELVYRNSADASKATLEVFEARQKMLEEQNKRRKDMLAKVISARKKQTTEEVKRLHNIHEELQKLDMLLSNDVGILRNKIEEASLDFVEAQKRYNKAEKEFFDAKQNLFVKLEKKELLTKLLCTIIEQNELRKAQKLSELMGKLNINETTNSVILKPDNQSALKGGEEKLEAEKVKQSS